MEDDAVPDSEGEEYLPVVRNPVQKTPAPTDSISSFPVKPVPSTKESISSSSSAAPPKARPKPKPLFKGAPAAVARPAAGDSSIIESYSGMTASERVKMRSRGALQPSTPDLISTPATRMPVSSSEIVEIFSDSDDELTIAKQKPRPKASAPTASSSSSSDGPPMPGPNQPAPKRPPLPPPFPYASSPLPASDAFPLSTATTHQPPDDDDFVPPIVTLTTSAVSSPSVGKTQRLTIKLPPLKPPSPDRFDGFDELDDRGGGMAPPPRPTGAVDPGPSSSSAGAAADGAPPAKPPKKSRKKKEKGAEEGEAEREKPAKKPRTKKVKTSAGAEAGEEGGSGQEKPMPKKKQGTGKGKEKEKAFPSAEFIQSEDDDEPVDGALPPPPLRSLVDVAGLLRSRYR
ncbi:hypothetical protein B0H14DRAFT_1026920 [Mycena olivaceomarginata]|nr:hypothetical protein B0H14DRAFT_1026920 [Mycena olivaceomarginata]